MTPDKPKCEHSEVIQQSAWGGYPRCRECEMRFVPSDVLEECRAFVSNCVLEDQANDFFDSPASRLLRRISEALERP